MSRWHTKCYEPDIFVDGTFPRCRRCGMAPSITDVTPPERSIDPPWTVRANETRGQLRLYWPPCVPYKESTWDDEDSEFGLDRLYDESRCVRQAPAMDDTSTTGAQAPLSPVYQRRLGTGELRLICLETPQHPSDPVHLTLETYDRNNCPEYEATSYMWGGEDGDYTPSSPIYIGPHWDILFQTRNCHSMLQCLRPPRGIRVVWIDAICINQGDLWERGDQVDAMHLTYKRSMRVIVYLGHDVVHKRGPDSYPLRCGLEKIQEMPGFLNQLFRRRYFSRVWMIQELILSPMVIIPFRDVEFTVTRLALKVLDDLHSERHLLNRPAPTLADSMDSASESQNTEDPSSLWEKFGIPWFRHAAKGTDLNGDVFQVLQQTWNSRATDQRDQVYGVLGLFNDKYRRIGGSLKPDYTITRAHTLIGVFAYLLLNLGRSEILTAAIGLDAPSPYPSWMPKWISSPIALEEYVPTYYSDYHYLSEIQYLLQEDTRYHIIVFQDDPGDLSSPMAQEDRLRDSKWLQRSSVGTRTAGLTITLIRLLDFNRAPVFCEVLPGERGNNGYRYEINSPSCKLTFLTPREGLATTVPDGCYQLFILRQSRRRGHLFLILQRSSPYNDHEYRMVSCFNFERLALIAHGPPMELQMAWERRDRQYRMVNNMRLSENLKGISQDVEGHLSNLSGDKPIAASGEGKVFGQLFADNWPCDRFALDIIQGYINELRGCGPGLIDSYKIRLRMLVGEDQFQIEHDHVVFHLRRDEWERVRPSYCFKGPLDPRTLYMRADLRLPKGLSLMCHYRSSTRMEIQWEWLDDKTGDIPRWRAIDQLTVDEKATPRGDIVHIRAKIDDIRRFIEVSECTAAVTRLMGARAHFNNEMSETEIYLRKRTPAEEFVKCHHWPQVALDEFKMDGRLEKVTIL